jgi:tetratricopeptide (TPR) repeat protein
MSIQLRKAIAALVIVGCGAAFAIGAVSARPERDVTTRSDEAYAAYEQGMEHLAQFRYEEAQRSWRRAVELDPHFAMAWGRIANLSMSMGQRDSANAALAQARASSARLQEIERLRLDKVEARIQRRLEAEFEASRSILQRYPDDTESMLSIHAHSRARGDLDTCLEMLERVLAIEPENFVVYNELGYVLADLGRFDEATAAFQKYAFINPDEPNPHDSLGELYERIGRYEDAVAEYERALEVDPRFWFAYIHQARVALTLGRFDKAEAILDKAADAADTPGSEFHNAFMRVDLAYQRDGVGAMVEAISDLPPLPDAWQTDSLWVAAWGARLARDSAALDAVTRKFDKMKARFEEEAPEEPFLAKRFARTARFLDSQRAWLNGDFASADEAITDLMEQRTEWFMSDCMLLDQAQLLTELGRYDEVAARLQPVLDRNPRHPEANLRMGIAMARAGRSVAAASHCAMALASWGKADRGHRLVAQADRLFEEALRKSARESTPTS